MKPNPHPKPGSPVVLVHGNRETDAVWGPLIAALGRRGVTDVSCLSPPGFGAPAPAGFGAADWSAAEELAAEQLGPAL